MKTVCEHCKENVCKYEKTEQSVKQLEQILYMLDF